MIFVLIHFVYFYAQLFETVTNESQHIPLLTSLDFIVSALHQFPEMFIPSMSVILNQNRSSREESKNEAVVYSKEKLLLQPAFGS